MMTRSRSYKEDLLKALQNREEAKEYLNAALEDSNPQVFLLALQDVIEANVDITPLVLLSDINREWDKTLAQKGNPELADIKSILSSLGYRLAIDIESETSPRS